MVVASKNQRFVYGITKAIAYTQEEEEDFLTLSLFLSLDFVGVELVLKCFCWPS